VWSREGTQNKLATATQPQLPKTITEFKRATGFQISRRTSSQVGVFDLMRDGTSLLQCQIIILILSHGGG
jgi:hypothetical protein